LLGIGDKGIGLTLVKTDQDEVLEYLFRMIGATELPDGLAQVVVLNTNPIVAVRSPRFARRFFWVNYRRECSNGRPLP
jgi:hypothetical protein